MLADEDPGGAGPSVDPISEAWGAGVLEWMHELRLAERRSIARDLHDRLGHSINATQRQLELFALYRESNPVLAAEKVEAARRTNQKSTDILRALAGDLYAADGFQGLEKELHAFAAESAPEGTEVRVVIRGEESTACPALVGEVFLVLREAAYNSFRHAMASQVVIEVGITPAGIACSVRDDGDGFDAVAPRSADRLGIASMRDRVDLLGGRLSITAEPRGGTRVEFAVPAPGTHLAEHAD